MALSRLAFCSLTLPNIRPTVTVQLCDQQSGTRELLQTSCRSCFTACPAAIDNSTVPCMLQGRGRRWRAERLGGPGSKQRCLS
jgi:hypothetical protein